MLRRVKVCKMFKFIYKLHLKIFLYVYFPEKIRLNCFNIKGERKEGDWSVAKNLLKPTDGGKVKVIPPDFISP